MAGLKTVFGKTVKIDMPPGTSPRADTTDMTLRRIYMFRKRKKKKIRMAYSRNPRLTGKVGVCFGLPMLALWILRCYEIDSWTTLTSIISYASLAFIIGFGLYHWVFCRRVVTCSVALGDFRHSMYLRFGRRYLPVGLVAVMVVYPLVPVLLTLIDNGFGGFTAAAFMHYFDATAWMLVLMAYKVVDSYIDYTDYYRSPESSREKLDWY